MAVEYSVDTCKQLARRFGQASVHRPMRVGRYEPGTELTYEVTGVAPARKAAVRLRIEKFVGGGFAGQVYRVEVLSIDAPDGPIEGLNVGGSYAVKILVPPTSFSRRFRDMIYKLGFQAPFSLQVNPFAARAGALWQTFIRRGAAARFGSDRCVVNIHATFVDPTLGSCGEISEWVDGRVWRFEANDRLDALKEWKRGRSPAPDKAGSPEYRAKRAFMARFVELLHEMGAREFARQYEWWTCKSQPNVLKRRDGEDDPAAGLTAVDFRAGLALLPVLPMSPGDFKLIFTGLLHGSLVQFDRGSLAKLRSFIDARPDEFADLSDALDELVAAEGQYRNSQIDVTHNHARLLYSRKLWSSILDATVTGWRVANITDDECTASLRRSSLLTVAFALLGMLPTLVRAGAAALLVWVLWTGNGSAEVVLSIVALAVIVPALARVLWKVWARADIERHYRKLLTGGGYFGRAWRAHVAEALITWHRAGRVGSEQAWAIADRPARFLLHLPLSVLPAFLHRLLTDRQYAAEKLAYVFVRPIRLLLNADAREQWLRDMIAEGQANHMLTGEDAQRIESRIKEPYVQKYLQSLAIHVCTLPVTQIVSVTVATIYIAMNWGAQPFWTLFWTGWAIVGIFQITPISPGSLTRGLYVLYLVIRERNFKDYNIAVFLGFFKYVGYLAFPIQMAYRYPALARFMAGHWATGAVHVLPVFGERGALLEHAVFDLFYNHPLTSRRRINERTERRRALPARLWHAAPLALGGFGMLAGVDALYARFGGFVPDLPAIWWQAIWPPLLVGLATAALAGSTAIPRRIAASAVVGLTVGALYGVSHLAMGHFYTSGGGWPVVTTNWVWDTAMILLWRVFVFALVAVIGGILAETVVLEPRR